MHPCMSYQPLLHAAHPLAQSDLVMPVDASVYDRVIALGASGTEQRFINLVTGWPGTAPTAMW